MYICAYTRSRIYKLTCHILPLFANYWIRGPLLEASRESETHEPTALAEAPSTKCGYNLEFQSGASEFGPAFADSGFSIPELRNTCSTWSIPSSTKPYIPANPAVIHRVLSTLVLLEKIDWALYLYPLVGSI